MLDDDKVKRGMLGEARVQSLKISKYTLCYLVTLFAMYGEEEAGIPVKP
jgi:hypothetical protein